MDLQRLLVTPTDTTYKLTTERLFFNPAPSKEEMNNSRKTILSSKTIKGSEKPPTDGSPVLRNRWQPKVWHQWPSLESHKARQGAQWNMSRTPFVPSCGKGTITS